MLHQVLGIVCSVTPLLTTQQEMRLNIAGNKQKFVKESISSTWFCWISPELQMQHSAFTSLSSPSSIRLPYTHTIKPRPLCVGQSWCTAGDNCPKASSRVFPHSTPRWDHHSTAHIHSLQLHLYGLTLVFSYVTFCLSTKARLLLYSFVLFVPQSRTKCHNCPETIPWWSQWPSIDKLWYSNLW